MPIIDTTLYIKQIAVGPMMNFAYLVGPAEGSEAVLIDPSWNAGKLMNEAASDSRRIVAVLATHGHFDHVNALREVLAKTGAALYVHRDEPMDVPEDAAVTRTRDGSVIETAGLAITCLHTPGHTPGSQCFLIDNALFTGDTLFDGACGRVDLEGGNPDDMVTSLARLAELPGSTVVYPGHNYGRTAVTTIEQQRRTNPYMNERAETMM